MSKADKVMTMQCRDCGNDFTVARKATAVQLRFCSSCMPASAPRAPKVPKTVTTEPTDLVLKCGYCEKKFTVARRAVGGQRSLMRRFCCMEHARQAQREWRAKHRRKYDPDRPKPAPVKDYSRSKLVGPPAQLSTPVNERELKVDRTEWKMLMAGQKLVIKEIQKRNKTEDEEGIRELAGVWSVLDAKLKRIGWI